MTLAPEFTRPDYNCTAWPKLSDRLVISPRVALLLSVSPYIRTNRNSSVERQLGFLLREDRDCVEGKTAWTCPRHKTWPLTTVFAPPSDCFKLEIVTLCDFFDCVCGGPSQVNARLGFFLLHKAIPSTRCALLPSTLWFRRPEQTLTHRMARASLLLADFEQTHYHRVWCNRLGSGLATI